MMASSRPACPTQPNPFSKAGLTVDPAHHGLVPRTENTEQNQQGPKWTCFDRAELCAVCLGVPFMETWDTYSGQSEPASLTRSTCPSLGRMALDQDCFPRRQGSVER